MSKDKNKYGLSRRLPVEIKRTVRKRCGFACVKCGDLFVDYEHINPVFSEAKKHCADNITLLCPSDHAKVTRGLFSKADVEGWNADPYAKEHNLISTDLALIDSDISLEFASNSISGLKFGMRRPIVDLPAVNVSAI
jgi:hypothetical protein